MSKFGFGVFLCFLLNSAYATDAVIGPVLLDSVAIVNVASSGHAAGNVEIKVTNGISDLKGLSCDKNYITTKKNTDGGYKEMVSLLIAAHVAKKPVLMALSDAPANSAFSGRCSILWVTLQN